MRFDNSYARLPERFYSRLRPTPVSDPRLVWLNRELAEELGGRFDVEAADPRSLGMLFSGQALFDGSEPIALAYAGHQFGHFVPSLGDGRALLLGEVVDPSGRRRDLQLKGSGPTPYSRRGDGRAALGPVLREVIISEAMFHLGVPTTRTLAAVTTGELVMRERPLPGAILARVAASHLRIGTFEYFAARGDREALRILADYAIERHYPAIAGNPYLGLLDAVIDSQARLMAHWQAKGFIHGVMNTDNMMISGETIDYGPCAFMDDYKTLKVYSSIDHQGRYAYGNQPHVARWNLGSLAHCLLPLIDDDAGRAVEFAGAALESFDTRFQSYWLAAMINKLGLQEMREGDEELVGEFLRLLEKEGADFTNSFRSLIGIAEGRSAAFSLRNSITASPAFAPWEVRWKRRLRVAADAQGKSIESLMADTVALLRQTNPAVIPRNHRVEQVIASAVEHATFEPLESWLEILRQPYRETGAAPEFQDPPNPHEVVERTFCGT